MTDHAMLPRRADAPTFADTARRPSTLRLTLLAGLTALLAACGGGGGDDEGSSAAQPVPGEQRATQRPLDVAVDGDGYFVYEDASGRTVYSRVASLKQDADGALVDGYGRRLLGTAVRDTNAASPGREAAASAEASTTAEALPAIPALRHARPTSQVTYEGNLDARESSPTDVVFDANDPFSFNQARTVTLYDAQGFAQALTLYFVKDVTGGSWAVRAQLDGTDIPFDPVDPTLLTATLTFDSTGALTSPTAPLTLALSTTFNATTLGDVSLDLTRVTQYATSFGSTRFTQDGEAAGWLQSLDISPDGWVDAYYDNGHSYPLGRIRLADFTANDRLTAAGQDGWLCAAGCTPPRYAAPGSLLTGLLVTRRIETPATR